MPLFNPFSTSHSLIPLTLPGADAVHMRNQGNMKLGQVASEYGLVASTLRKATPGKVFLTRAEFTREKDLFGK